MDYKVDPKTGCWIWQKSLRNGYGQKYIGSLFVYAHRYYYEQSKGKIPEGKCIDHLCRNRSCVNPDHLEAVSQATNVRRGTLTKLTIEDVKNIRVLLKTMPRPTVAKIYQVSTSTIQAIHENRHWKITEQV